MKSLFPSLCEMTTKHKASSDRGRGPKWIFPLEQSNQSMVHKEEKARLARPKIDS